MYNSRNHTKILFTLFLTLIVISCVKEKGLPPCKSDCANIVFAGTVVNGAYNISAANTKIKVTTSILSANPYSGTIYDVGTVYTDDNGKFTLSRMIDTSVYRSFSVIATAPPDYITSPAFLNQVNEFTTYNEAVFFYMIDSSTQLIRLGVFPITKLTVNLHRGTPLPVTGEYAVSFEITFQGNGLFSYNSAFCEYEETTSNTDTTVYLDTSPNLYTFIQWYKNTDSGTVVYGTDSIICLPNVANKIDVTY